MNWLLSVGDTDIMRDAVSSSTVFWHRAGKARTRVTLTLILTLATLLLGVVALIGPQRIGFGWLTEDYAVLAFAFALLVWALFTGWTVFKFIPSRNDRIVLALRSVVRGQIDPLEANIQALPAEQLLAKTAEFKERLAAGEPLDAIRPEAYACVREASRRAKNHRQFECQLIGGQVIERSNVAEMRTGEGKTIVCYMANYMKVLQGLKVHMVTVNDYLVRRDAEFCRPIFELLGVTVGFISAEMETFGPGAEERRVAYGCDITYGTNSEFGFDFLRDNMKHSVRDQVQGPQDFAVVDEVDSILIDEARTPLIISGPAHDDVSVYRVADNTARVLIQRQQKANQEMARRIDDLEANPPPNAKSDAKFKDGIKKFRTDPNWLSSDEAEAIGHLQYYVVEADRKSVHMTEHGAKAAQNELGIGSFYDTKNMNWPHYIDNALRAHLVYTLDKEYVIQDDIIVIVDEFTGRLMQGRQWSDGLHQAVEAKEKVTVKQENQTLATITLQNLFKMYKALAGMTGTAMTESEEFMKIYKLEVVAIPTNRPVRRIDYNDKIFKTTTNKFDAIVEEIRSYSQNGFPSDPWSLLDMLKTARQVLEDNLPEDSAAATAQQEQIQSIRSAISAYNDGKGDAKVLEDAYHTIMQGKVGGRPILVGTVSVENSEKLSQALMRRHGIEHEVLNAKNHAREAEIVAKAGQQHEFMRGKKREIHGNVTIATNMAGRGTDIRLGEGVADIGGLHVVGTERHESRRIDNQLRGRCGRQGDPGSSRFFLSLDDDLLRLFMGEWVLRMLNMLGFEEGMAIEDKRLNRGIEKAQKKVEERNFNVRKSLLDYDEVMDHQRRTFYSMRQQVVEGRGLSEMIWEMIDQSVADSIERFYDRQYPAICVSEWVGQHLGVHIEPSKLDPHDLKSLQAQVRDLASHEIRSTIQRTFGEYVDPAVDPEEWDIRGLVSWAASYGVTWTQSDIKKGNPDDLLEQLTEAAQKKIENEDLTPLEQYVDPLYAKARLVRWAREKFDVQVPLDEIAAAPPDEAERVFRDRMREAYRRREIEYPVGAVIEYALQRGGSNVNEFYNRVAIWANRKYNLNWTYEHFNGKDPQQIFAELREVNEKALEELRSSNGQPIGVLVREFEAALTTHSNGQLETWAQQRFGPAMEGRPLDLAGDLREQFRQLGYEMLRFELTQLERYVLLNTFDSVWKDHMYSMDLLRHGIGLRGYAERDPKIEYKREGTRLFNEMLSNIRERVTDLIFKVNVPGFGAGGFGDAAVPSGSPPAAPAGTTQAGLAYQNVQTSKADATGTGFSAQTADQEAAMAKQGEAAQPKTIRREEPKVGRNDPCPCGSGKKYKQCHGKGS